MSDAPRPFLSTPPRRLLFAALYFSEGAPIGYIWWALPTKLRAAGVPVERITQLTALLILPWAFKFLWAPLVDALPIPRLGVRGWIIIAQLCMGAALLPLMFLDPSLNLGWFSGILFLHAFTAATQDAAVDAYAIASIEPEHRGATNAWMQVGMLTGRSVFGGLALYVERWLGQTPVLIALLVCVWSTMFLVLSTGDATVGVGADQGGDRAGNFIRTLRHALASKSTWLGLAFAGVGGAAYEALGAVAGPMLVDRGASEETIGLFFAGPVVVCMAAGAGAGGRMGDRLGRTATVRAAMFAIVGCTLTIAAIFALAWPPIAVFVALAGLYVLIGAFTASSYALFMDVTDPRLGATQFSAFMGTTNLCEAWSALAIGRAIRLFDYPVAIALLALPTLMATTLVSRLQPENADESPGKTEPADRGGENV